MRISIQVEKYVNFLQTASQHEIKRNEDRMNGTIKTEQEWKQRYLADSSQQFEVLTDEYRNLASKKNKTPEEIRKMQDMYRDGFLKFGGEFVTYIDQKYGNNDGKLTQNEYVNYEVSSFDKKYVKELNINPSVGAANIFAHMDCNDDNQVDVKEMAATLSMFDVSLGLNGDKAGGINGKIKVQDFHGNVTNLIKPSSDPKGEAMDEKVQMMYNFLFSKN